MQTVEWVDGKVRFLDQTRLPQEEIAVETDDFRIVGEAIRKLQIRGAPAIGVAAAFGALLAVRHTPFPGIPEMKSRLHTAVDFLSSTRPTAVNLFAALRRVSDAAERPGITNGEQLWSELLREALAIQREDVEACTKIGEYGAELIHQGSSVLTHCNAGALATAGEGTALSIIFKAWEQGRIVKVYAGETRPLLQGARLTTWELMRRGIPTVLITDNAAGLIMAKGMVQAVVVGADRIALNGDTANKVGTYPLAVLANRHRIPFYVAAPRSTFDPATATGADIAIEERAEHEITHVAGTRVAPEGVAVYAPAFDVTPNELIAAFVTEEGVLVPPFQRSLRAMLGVNAKQGGMHG